MNNREIKVMLKNAYAISESLDGKRFVRKYERRSLQIVDIIKLEFKYMGVQSIMSGMIFIFFVWAIAKTERMDLIWGVSSMIPICAMVPMIFLSKSERHGMIELEAAARFSLRFVRYVRMFIIGILTMGLFIALGCVLKTMLFLTGVDYLIMVVIPYLISDLGAMIVTRKWHRGNNVIGIILVCGVSCFVPFAIRELRNASLLPDVVLGIGIIVLGAFVIRECLLYIKEGEDVLWNLC